MNFTWASGSVPGPLNLCSIAGDSNKHVPMSCSSEAFGFCASGAGEVLGKFIGM